MSSYEKQARKARDYLLKARTNNCWPYLAGGDPSLETTAWAATALRDIAAIRQSAITYFQQSQNSDGGWSTAPHMLGSDWTGNLVLLVWRILIETDRADKASEPTFDKAFNYVIESQSEAFSPIVVFLYWLLHGKTVASGRGWSFTPGTFRWVEPTSYALMAIKPTSLAAKDPIKDAIADADRYLLDKYCQGGGWNYGENKRLSENLPPFPVTTAQAIIALQNYPDNEKVRHGLEFLTKKAREDNTVMALSWSIMARNCFKENTDTEVELLLQHQHENGSFFGSNFYTALATCALGVEEPGNPLRFGASPLEVTL